MIIPKVLVTSIAVLIVAVMAFVASGTHIAVNPAIPVLGATTGPDRFSPDGCETVNGNKECFYQARFNTASSGLVSFRTPNATTTIVIACNQITNPLASTIQIGWGAVPSATTTAFASMDIAANISKIINATSTLLTSATILGGVDGAIPPNSYVNARLGTSTQALLNAASMPTGGCNMIARPITY